MVGEMFKYLKRMNRFDESGAVMVEFGLMLPLFAIFMMFLIICYELVDVQIQLQVEAYAVLRRECTRINNSSGYYGRPRKVTVTKKKSVFLRGKMASIIGLSHIPLKATVSSYAGSMRAKGGISQYYKPYGDRYYWF